MTAVRCGADGAAGRSCVVRRCTVPVRRLTDERGGTVFYVCGPARRWERPPSPVLRFPGPGGMEKPLSPPPR